jgi:uncharacterized protein (TIRG00374 family)
MTKRSTTLIKIAISLVLIAIILVFFVDIRKVFSDLSHARLDYLLAAGLIMIAGTALRAVRWQVLLHPLGIRIPIQRLVYFYFIGAFFNLFLPTGLGGDVVKMAMLGQATKRGPEAVGTTLVDRASGLWVLFVLSLISLPFSYKLLPSGYSLSVIIAITAAGAVGIFVIMGTPLLPWLGSKIHLPGQEKLERFYHSVSQLGYRALAEACLISLVFDVLLIIFNILLALSLDIHLPLGIFLIFVPLTSLALTLPSISGFGARESAYIVLFSSVGVEPSTAGALSLANYFVTNVFVGLCGGGWYALVHLKELISHEPK